MLLEQERCVCNLHPYRPLERGGEFASSVVLEEERKCVAFSLHACMTLCAHQQGPTPYESDAEGRALCDDLIAVRPA